MRSAKRMLTLAVCCLVMLGAAALTLSPVSQDEIEKRVVAPSVQVAMFEGEGAVAQWRVAGSGTVFKVKRGDMEETYILTAGHVIDNAIEYVSTPPQPGEETDNKAKIAKFRDVVAIVEIHDEERVVAELRVRCKVLKFSPVEEEGGNDLAVLQPYRGEYFPYGARPLPPQKKTYMGQFVYHCGSLLGELVNSVTFGTISHTARMWKDRPFIQLSTTALPGSSGGGIFVVDENKCYYAGMLTRGTGETINLAVPITRIREQLKAWKMEFILDNAQ